MAWKRTGAFLFFCAGHSGEIPHRRMMQTTATLPRPKDCPPYQSPVFSPGATSEVAPCIFRGWFVAHIIARARRGGTREHRRTPRPYVINAVPVSYQDTVSRALRCAGCAFDCPDDQRTAARTPRLAKSLAQSLHKSRPDFLFAQLLHKRVGLHRICTDFPASSCPKKHNNY